MASTPSNSIKWYIKLCISFLEFVWLFDQEYSRQHNQSCLSVVLTHSTIVSGLRLKKKINHSLKYFFLGNNFKYV